MMEDKNTSPSPNGLKELLNKISKGIALAEQEKRLKGETFNVFSILNMERNENRTHSAFLTELLNTKGSHLKGDLFLRLFLKMVKSKYGIAFKEWQSLANAGIKAEYYIGPRDDENGTGGRIDIFIDNPAEGCISIENKIDAYDQNRQILRYKSHKSGKNQVLYLTKFGDEPSKESSSDLKNGKELEIGEVLEIEKVGYLTLSYRDDIASWLEACIKESFDSPILRETLKQYLILIKKITNSGYMENKELTMAMFGQHDEAAFVAENFLKEKQKLLEDTLKKIVARLNENDIQATIESNPVDTWIKIISKKGMKSPNINFAIGNFSFYSSVFKDYPEVFVGVFCRDGSGNDNSFPQKEIGNNDQYLSGWWPRTRKIVQPNESDLKINFCNPDFLVKYIAKEDFRQTVVNQIVTQTNEFIKNYKEKVFNP